MNAWGDVVYVMFKNPRCRDIVGEIQFVHPRFLDIRMKFGSHDTYETGRFAAEMRYDRVNVTSS